MSKKPVDNYAGCIMGGAIGDALGAPIEFMSYNSITKKYGISGVQDFVEFGNGKGEITDDTQMLLFTADGILRSWHRAWIKGIGGAYSQLCYNSYLRWLYTQRDPNGKEDYSIPDLDGWLIRESFLYQRRAPGITCLTALEKGEPGSLFHSINNSKGCGGIMRVAPVGLLFHRYPEQAFQLGAELAAMTHGHPSGFLSAGFLSALIAYLNKGLDLIEAISNSTLILKTYSNHEETLLAVEKALKLFYEGNPNWHKVESLGGGWVGEEALSISLYCALSHQKNFEEAIKLAINHSGDSDSTGSITGNIVGLICGEDAIPKRWRDNLCYYEKIKQIALDLHTEVMKDGQSSHDIWAFKYPHY